MTGMTVQKLPPTTVTAPAVYATAPAVVGASAAFDAIDANHDGVITRSEFNVVQAAPVMTGMTGMTVQKLPPTTVTAPAVYAAPQAAAMQTVQTAPMEASSL